MKLILAARIENPITKYPNKEATYRTYVPPILGQIIDLISPAKINIS